MTIDQAGAAAQDIYATITDWIVKSMEDNPGQFVMPWRGDGRLELPKNAVTGKAYRGINTIVLWAAAKERGFHSHLWATSRQWRKLGREVPARSKGATVILHIVFRDQEKEDENNTIFRHFTRTFTVFNAGEAGYVPEQSVREHDPGDWHRALAAENFIAASRARIEYGGDRAYYDPRSDHIQMPPRNAFFGTATSSPAEAFVATELHELVHWSGASHRLRRDFGKRFGDDAYAFEELVAEIGSCMLMAELSVTDRPRPDHAQYIADWLSILKRDKKAIFTAAAKAQQAITYLKDGERRAQAVQTTPPIKRVEMGHHLYA